MSCDRGGDRPFSLLAQPAVVTWVVAQPLDRVGRLLSCCPRHPPSCPRAVHFLASSQNSVLKCQSAHAIPVALGTRSQLCTSFPAWSGSSSCWPLPLTLEALPSFLPEICSAGSCWGLGAGRGSGALSPTPCAWGAGISEIQALLSLLWGLS